jgi:hypothetical protein
MTNKNLPTSYIARSSKVYPNWDSWYESVPSAGNTGSTYVCISFQTLTEHEANQCNKNSCVQLKIDSPIEAGHTQGQKHRHKTESKKTVCGATIEI